MALLPRPCIDCGVVVRSNRCNECQQKIEARRPSRIARGYDKEWVRLSKWARSMQPWCSFCGSNKDLTADHITPLASGGLSVPSNVRVLCRSCNSAKGTFIRKNPELEKVLRKIGINNKETWDKIS